jgi:hypothetical protein
VAVEVFIVTRIFPLLEEFLQTTTMRMVRASGVEYQLQSSTIARMVRPTAVEQPQCEFTMLKMLRATNIEA